MEAMVQTKAATVADMEAADVEARLVTHAEVCVSLSSQARTVADDLRLRSHE